MGLLIQAAMIFFGTLLAAGLLALAEPRATTVAIPMEKATAAAVLPAGGAVQPAAAVRPQR